MSVRRTDEEAARLGHPSYVWRAGQERRLALIRRWAATDGARVLVDGCGLGLYVRALRRYSPHVVGLDIDAKVLRGSGLNGLVQAAAEALPFPDNTFDTVLSHEVIEHVMDDQAAVAEMVRVLKPGGRAIIFCPNRWYPFETHGHFWRGRYHFGNTPLINWLPDPIRNRLAPHVRTYSGRALKRLFAGLPVRIVYHTRIFPGYDNLIARFPRLGKAIRWLTYKLERTPLRLFGISHFLVVEKVGFSAVGPPERS